MMTASGAQKRIEQIKQKSTNQNAERYALPIHISLEQLLEDFTVDCIDVRELKGFFLPKLLAKAKFLKTKHILLVRQNFEPTPLYSVLGKLGFVYRTQKTDSMYHSYFIRKKEILS